ncbi:DUF4041 domain-containing protein [Fructobacillus papyrifericola]|uniref:DUF4041 domain-containing protein n=1 Tax=Fructobacillus papyrifericola TaxID=2713172 RepID=A0ABS5QTJ4_9LACO|nr:DUF4041 domain-containing protein [Fructobacillus papyrifericola]MBS9336446.1 DUF4041 domain-containing protein [Fructobacillus papyrifericola]
MFNKKEKLQSELSQLKSEIALKKSELHDILIDIKSNSATLKNQQKKEIKTALLEKERKLAQLSEQRMSEIESNAIQKTRELEHIIQSKKQELNQCERDLANKKKQIQEAEKELNGIENDITAGFYKPTYEFADSLSYKYELQEIIEKEKYEVKNNLATYVIQQITFDGSPSKGIKMQKKSAQALIRAFNGEASGIINKVNATNYEKKSEGIVKSANKLSDLFETVNFVRLSSSYVDLKLQELKLSVEYALKKQEEKDKLREERQRDREEKQLRLEIEKEKKSLNKERTQFTNALSKLLQQEQSKEVIEQTQILKEKINSLNDQEKDLDFRIENSKAGYIYIISNVGSFGEGVFKIGVTRRLDPTERIAELSSASVPFKFDIHALIFSDDAFGLEHDLHEHFKENKINHVNNRKEYFNTSLEEIKNYVQNNKNITIEWHDEPENSEFILSQQFINNGGKS